MRAISKPKGLMMRLTEAVGKKIDEGTHKTEFTSSASIYRVPDELRKLNESAYVPRLVSIGPLHSEDRNYFKSPVHNIKLSYVNFLLSRSTCVGSDQRQLILLECLTQMRESLEEAKKCYVEEVYDKLDEEMLVIDGCFILDMTCYCSRTSFLSSFSRGCSGSQSHLYRNQKNQVCIQSAPSGEEFKIRFNEYKCLSKIIYGARFVIPTLFIYESTEPFLRNLVAYEQCRPGVCRYFTSYANFMDTLISSDKDVHVLDKAGIIRNHLGAGEDVTKFFNNLCKEVVLKESYNYFAETISAANHYSKAFWTDLMEYHLFEKIMASEITEEKDEEALFTINTEAKKDKIRQIIEYQKSLYFSSSSFSSAATSSSSFSSSRISKSLLDLMKEGSTSLRRLFDMEHTSLATHMNDYSGSPIIKSIPLWGSDTDDGVHDDPWKSINRNVGPVFGSGSGAQSVLGAESRSMDGIGLPVGRKPRISKHRLNRTKSFRRLPRFSFWRSRDFRFGLRLRRLRSMICGRKF
ncbi:unnamed protein product [Camellia sinensis]